MSMFRRLFLFCILLCGLACHNITAATKLEAEKAKCLHSSVVSDSQFSKGKAVRITEGNGSISFSFKAGKQGKYKVYVTGSGVGDAVFCPHHRGDLALGVVVLATAL